MKSFEIKPLDRQLQASLQSKLDRKTKPQGSLGRLESLALQLGLIQQTLTPVLHKPSMVVFAGDHGLAAAGVSPFPQAVTAQMVLNFLAGGAAINVLCQSFGVELTVVNAGVNADFPVHPQLINAPLGRGTANSLLEPAMTMPQLDAALQQGAEIVAAKAKAGCSVIGFGEMGIANSSAAALLLAHLCALPLSTCVGRGTGLDDAGLLHKTRILEQVLRRHANVADPLEALAAFGGFEIAMMVGAYLAAAENGLLIVVDGFIASAALLVASRLYPAVLEYCVFAHQSEENGHRALLRELKAEPLLNLELRLGEGSGAVLAFPLLQAAVAILNEMASFESAGVSDRAHA